MGAVPESLAAELKQQLGLGRAVETGTYLGDGALRLAAIFPSVVTIELADELYEQASRRLASEPAIEVLHGNSSERLAALANPQVATLYFLDGHWSGGSTAGADSECPVMGELAALRGGHGDDCLFIDDARLFTAPPPPPHDPAQWPTLIEVIDAIRDGWPDHHVTVLDDLVIAVPARAKPAVDRFGQQVSIPPRQSDGLLSRLAVRLRP